ncbi:MAG TPA: hypothetical protein VHE11_04945 [Steroidobacteraceae bacterium]|nr:hypothetical protein [Steroidobacteraceae bacterium]
MSSRRRHTRRADSPPRSRALRAGTGVARNVASLEVHGTVARADTPGQKS